MIKGIKSFLTLVVLTLSCSFPSVADDLVQRLFNIKDGLVNYTINDIAFDDYGYVWLATEQGVFRVSDTVTRRIDQPDSDNALAAENIHLIAKVTSQRLLVASGTSLYLYDIKLNRFSDDIIAGLITSDDSVVDETRLDNGNLILLTRLGQVLEFDVNSLSISVLTAQELDKTLQWNSVNQLSNGHYIYSSAYEVVIKNPAGKLIEQIKRPVNNLLIQKVFIDSSQHIWILTNKGLYELNPLNYQMNAVVGLPYYIEKVIEDARGNLWLSAKSGLFSWDRQSSKPISYKEQLKNNADIDYIDDIAIDEDGLIWLGGAGEGLALLAIAPDFLLESFTHSSAYQIEDDMIWSIYAEQDKVWLGGDGGLTIVDKSAKTSKYLIPTGFEARDSIYGVNELDNQHIVVTTTSGLFVINKQTDQQVDFSDFAALSDSLKGEILFNSYADPLPNGRVWWGATNLVYYWQPGLDDIESISLKDHIPQTQSVRIRSMFRENHDRLWIGGSGFFGYIDSNNNAVSLSEMLGENVKDMTVNNILNVDERTLWLGTRQNGVIVFDTQTHETLSMSDYWHVDCPTIYFIEQTEKNNLVGCTSTLIRQNKQTKAIDAFSTSDGFIGNEFNESAAYYDPNAGLYIGGPNGAMLVDIDKLKRRVSNDGIALESIAIYYEDNTEYHLVPDSFNLVQPGAKLISFQITTFDYVDETPISLKYRLLHEHNSLDSQYIYLQGQTQINIADLKAGEYTLELLHKKHGMWASSPFQFSFKVEQFWWASQWFKALVLFVILFGAFTSLWFRKKQINRVIGINQALRESEDKLRQSLRGSDSDLWEWQASTNQIQFDNKSGLLGEGRKLSYLVSDLPIVAADKDNLQQQWRALLKGDKETIDIEFRYYRGEEAIGWLRIRGRAVTRNQTTGQLDQVAGIYTEVSEQRELQNEIDLFAKAFENTSEGMLILDSRKRVKLLNTAAATIFTTQHEALNGRGFESLLYVDHGSKNIDDLLQNSRSWNGELSFKRASNEHFPVWVNISKMSDKRDISQHYVVVFSDITQRKKYESNLQHLANNDALTGLANRAMFNRRLQKIIQQAHRSNEKLALLFLDLDRFKHVNDSYGHSMGDALLVEAAKRLQHSVEAEHLVCRFGGDEFVILIRNANSIDQINLIAETILKTIEAPFRLFGREFFVSTSIGISMWPEDSQDAETLIKNADLAMYHAKEEGRGNFQYYSAERNAEAQYHLKIEADLRSAIENNDFELYYQPQIDILQGDKFVGMEALIRWHHPVEGFIRPDIFIKVAESCGLIIDIDRWVLRQACIDGARWHALYDQPFQLSVNVSAVQFRQVDFIDNLKATLADTGMPATCLAIEITEGVLMKELQVARSHLTQLKQLGIEVAIDDFGTGYSSLAYLRSFEVNTLKIDRSFLIDIATNEADQAIVSSIIELARNLKLQVVAEGVESHAQMEQVFSRGCYIIQGYFFAKPMPKAELDKFIGIGKSCKK
ncbi:EAL domain-containing protein [Shewanella sp. UCD-KL21]|uniref:EAL domain-containing protein n=1 Tax=Shewanella sp. UCD-KL21 TaxID=1917164 RepID=UPI0009704D66|nr:EAL domain-containing protein [Shewanella sp. UCD-KL21]